MQSAHEVPTLLFLHGFLGNGEDWLPLMDALSLTFRCISVDLPGHGHSTTEESVGDYELEPKKQNEDSEDDAWSVQGLASALSLLVEKLGDENVVLVGYSMGARIALHMALNTSGMVILEFGVCSI